MVELTDIQFQVLEYIVINDGHNESAPSIVSTHLYNFTLKELEQKELIHVAWVEGPEPYAIRILDKAYALIELRKIENEKNLESLLLQHDLDLESYKVLANLNSDSEYNKSFIDEMDQDVYDDIMKHLEELDYVSEGKTMDDPDYIINRKGIVFLKKVNDSLINPNNMDSQDQLGSNNNVYIKNGKTTDVIKTIFALCKLDVFVDSMGNHIDDKKVMETLSVVFNEPSIKSYSPKLSSSKRKSNLTTFIDIGNQISEKLEEYFVKEYTKSQKEC